MKVGHCRPASETPFKWAFHWRADSGPDCMLAGLLPMYDIDLQLSQETPASWKCVQSWSPHLLAGQSAMEFSVPLH